MAYVEEKVKKYLREKTSSVNVDYKFLVAFLIFIVVPIETFSKLKTIEKV